MKSRSRDIDSLKLSHRFEIWQAHRQQCCRCACQISERSDKYKYQSRGFETSRDLTIRRLIGYWNGAQYPAAVPCVCKHMFPFNQRWTMNTFYSWQYIRVSFDTCLDAAFYILQLRLTWAPLPTQCRLTKVVLIVAEIQLINVFILYLFSHHDIYGLVQDCNNFIANALDLLQSCTKPSIYCVKRRDVPNI